jgi:hypothetical protein
MGSARPGVAFPRGGSCSLLMLCASFDVRRPQGTFLLHRRLARWLLLGPILVLAGLAVLLAARCLQVNKVNAAVTVTGLSFVTVTFSKQNKEQLSSSLRFKPHLTCSSYLPTRVWHAVSTSFTGARLGERVKMTYKTVNNTAGLIAALKSAKSGDVIQLESGSYAGLVLKSLNLRMSRSSRRTRASRPF